MSRFWTEWLHDPTCFVWQGTLFIKLIISSFILISAVKETFFMVLPRSWMKRNPLLIEQTLTYAILNIFAAWHRHIMMRRLCFSFICCIYPDSDLLSYCLGGNWKKQKKEVRWGGMVWEINQHSSVERGDLFRDTLLVFFPLKEKKNPFNPHMSLI